MQEEIIDSGYALEQKIRSRRVSITEVSNGFILASELVDSNGYPERVVGHYVEQTLTEALERANAIFSGVN